jgi:drug/metabolite transporter (DMT)-like permease
MTDAAEALAKSRFIILSVLRLTGALMLMAGLVLVSGNWQPLGGDVDRIAGVVLVLVGAFDFAVAPMLLARSWKR